MWVWIALLVSGGIMLVVTVFYLTSKNDNAAIFLSIAGAFIFLGALMRDDTGVPRNEISSGTYALMGMADVVKGQQPYLHMLLNRQAEERCYTFPKDMVLVEKSTIGPPNVLEVVEKGGLKKATLRFSY